MAHVTVTVQDLDLIDAQGEDEMIEYATDLVGEFASCLGLELDITAGDLSVTACWVQVEVSGDSQDVSLFNRRWSEEY